MTFNKEGNFFITDIENKIFIIASTYNSSLKSDISLIKKLKDVNYQGEIFIDMLLKNGNKSSRFFSAFFDGKSFKSLKILEDTSVFKPVEKVFYKNHPKIVENSILSRHQKLDLLTSI